MPRASLDKRRDDVAAMFDGVAKRYDLLNDVLSLGMDRRWRHAVAASLGARADERVLDLAAGTGTSSAALARHGASCVACDFSLGMLKVGAARLRGTQHEATSHDGRRAVSFVAGDALALPFGNGVFDAVTISFGLRNVADPVAALAEMRRVTRPGGRLLVCEFSQPTNSWFRKVYYEYLMKALPAVATRVSSSPDSYVYLAESIQAWPDQRALATIIGDAGWRHVSFRNLTGGIVALHRATR
jgi:demethylmenaquinone methyltransferase / 2-methoxy-6-polyprenyl-1,4-benzoquinol methylase